MKTLIPLSCALLLSTAAVLAGEPPGGGAGQNDCTAIRADKVNQSGSDKSGRDGYKVFPIQAPKRYENKNKARNEMPEDTAFTDSLRMLLGLKSPKIPNCLRQPRDRGLLRDE